MNRIQYNEYHLFPVDKHLLLTVQRIKQFAFKKEDKDHTLYFQLYEGIQNKTLLHWAALLHDIGKGVSAVGHPERGSKIAKTILTRMGYSKDDTEIVVFLIKEHLFLIKTATRRDINDEQTAVFCATKIKKVEQLKMLYLLTVADGMSTGDKAWAPWTEILVRDLFFRILRILEKGELATNEALEEVERKKRSILSLAKSSDEKNVVDGLIESMSPRYLLYVPERNICRHINLFRRLRDNEFIMEIEADGDSDTRCVTVCAKNKPGLLSRIAWAFSLNNLSILDLQAYTWRNDIALDIFRVKPPADRIFEEKIWVKVEESLAKALSGEIDLLAALYEKKSKQPNTEKSISADCNESSIVKIDNNTSDYFTIVEVFAYDFPGLLFLITDVIYKNGLDILISKVATKVDQVVDVFYVRELFGGKISSEENILKLKKALENILKEFSLQNKK